MMPTKSVFDTEVQDYDAWFKTNDKLFSLELAAIRELLPTDARGIEIGVGTGIFASKLGINDGIEPSEKMAAEAIRKGIKVIKASAEALPLADRAYQFALMVTVDCFLADTIKAFSEVWRILVCKGTFIIAFLDKATPLGKRYEENKHLHRSYQNANFHTAKEIEHLLIEAGFAIQERKQTIFSLENNEQEIKDGVGEGLFAVIKAEKIG